MMYKNYVIDVSRKYDIVMVETWTQKHGALPLHCPLSLYVKLEDPPIAISHGGFQDPHIHGHGSWDCA